MVNTDATLMAKSLSVVCNPEWMPAWVPQSAQRYLLHTEFGVSIRALARRSGCHASTILRQVRKFENKRDDLLVDEALMRLGCQRPDPPSPDDKEPRAMTAHLRSHPVPPTDEILEREARRILRRLSESGAVLAVAPEMDKAVVVRDLPSGKTARTAVVGRDIAEAMALKEWIACRKTGRIMRYAITSVGRAALKRLLATAGGGLGGVSGGFAEAPARFGDQHREWGEKTVTEVGRDTPRTLRYNVAESPLAALARRKDKTGQRFLSDDLVGAGERLREDFELAQMGPRVAQNWENFLTAGGHSGFSQGTGPAAGPTAARDRVTAALHDLGPGLGDVVLRCCCFLEGLEAAEKRMGWSARSGKIVLRIALARLQRHYEERYGKYGPMIG